MKKVLFLSLSLLLIYIAGMYRYPALMVLGVGQLLLLLFLTVQIHICGRRVQAGFRTKLVTAAKGERLSCELMVNYKGKLPSGGMVFFLRYGYGDKGRRKKLCADCDGKHAFSVEPLYCGLAELRLEEFRVYDYLGLGAVKSKMQEMMQIMVFPSEQALDIQMPDAGIYRDSGENRAEDYAVSENDEFRQVREYREGDSCRYLHWRLSARADELLVREYERERRGRTELFLDLRGREAAAPQVRDAFYELLSALVMGLLRRKDTIRVCWQGPGAVETMEIGDFAQCRKLLARLYLMTAAGEDRAAQETERKWEKQDKESFMLDMRFCLFRGDRLLYRFSQERILAEIQNVRILAGE